MTVNKTELNKERTVEQFDIYTKLYHCYKVKPAVDVNICLGCTDVFV